MSVWDIIRSVAQTKAEDGNDIPAGLRYGDVRELLRDVDLLRGELASRGMAAEEALTEIAALCGCPKWEYPGQVVRDVEGIASKLSTALDVLSALEVERKRGPTSVTCTLDSEAVERVSQHIEAQLKGEAPAPTIQFPPGTYPPLGAKESIAESLERLREDARPLILGSPNAILPIGVLVKVFDVVGDEIRPVAVFKHQTAVPRQGDLLLLTATKASLVRRLVAEVQWEPDDGAVNVLCTREEAE